jgi:hypothetical protein
MPGVITLIAVLDLVAGRLNTSDAAQKAIKDTLAAQPVFAALGAIGPDLADFMPNNLKPAALGSPGGGASPSVQFWQIVYKLANGSAGIPGLVPTLATLNGVLGQLDSIVAAQDLGKLENLQSNGSATQLTQAMADLSTIVQNVSNLVVPLLTNISVTQKPVINVPTGAPIPDPIAWDCRDILYWKKTGEFVDLLLQNAESSKDTRFLAYANGYAIAYAAKVCGSPFLNSIVGSTYRLNWWRERWLNVYGDAWVYGFYNAHPRPAFTNETPTPGYELWPNLCSANMQQRIELPGIDPNALLAIVTLAPSAPTSLPAILPSDFATFWFNTFKQVYGPLPTGSRFTEEGLNGAYLFTWLMLWFQTSGNGLGCNPAPPIAPPAGSCAANPPWVNAVTSPPGSGGSGALPPQPSVQRDPDTAEVACGIILALLGGAALAAADLAGGGAALGVGIDLIIQGESQINWDNLGCQLYWYHQYLYNGLNALHQAAELVGIVHPYASEFSTDSVTETLLGIPFGPYDSGARIVKSQLIPAVTPQFVPGPTGTFPAGLWNAGPAGWVQRATNPPELPTTTAYLTAAYPDFWIDDAAANPLSTGQVNVSGAWPQQDNPPNPDAPQQFGNAVDNAIDVLVNSKGPRPNWNLEGDRGLAYLTWVFQGAYSSPVTIQPE